MFHGRLTIGQIGAIIVCCSDEVVLQVNKGKIARYNLPKGEILMKMLRLIFAVVILLALTTASWAMEEQKPACPCGEKGCTAGEHFFSP